MNSVIITKINVKSINDVDLPARFLNNLRGVAIRLVAVYVFDDVHDGIIEKNLQGNN